MGLFKRTLVQQVVRSLQFFISANANKSIDAIILAGECAAIPELDKLIEEELDISAFVANPFVNMTLSNKIKPQDLSNDAVALMIACGLALRSFD